MKIDDYLFILLYFVFIMIVFLFLIFNDGKVKC